MSALQHTFAQILLDYGQPVCVRNSPEEDGTSCRAFLQPVSDTRGLPYQSVPSPIGTLRRDRFLYLGEAHVPLSEGGVVTCLGAAYTVSAAQVIRVGEAPVYWQAVLSPRPPACEEVGA